MTQEIYSYTKDSMQKNLDALAKKFQSIRTGKVNTSILDGIVVKYYDVPTPLSQLANISTPDATTLVVDPFDKSLIQDISKAINESNIGATPNDDDNAIKLFFAPMTTDKRQDGVKQAKKMCDEIKVAIRNSRKESNDKIKRLLKDKEISEDISKDAQAEIQKITDSFITKSDELLKNKEKDLLTI